MTSNKWYNSQFAGYIGKASCVAAILLSLGSCNRGCSEINRLDYEARTKRIQSVNPETYNNYINSRTNLAERLRKEDPVSIRDSFMEDRGNALKRKLDAIVGKDPFKE